MELIRNWIASVVLKEFPAATSVVGANRRTDELDYLFQGSRVKAEMLPLHRYQVVINGQP